MMKPYLCLILVVTLATFCSAEPTAEHAPDAPPEGVDPHLWSRMLEINQRSMEIHNLTADFRQEKHTALLKRPLVSTGRVWVMGERMRWDVLAPQKSVMLITDNEVRMYYPQQKVMEIFRIDQQLASLASSPLPRLSALREHFTFVQIDAQEIEPREGAENLLALELTPMSDAMAEHIARVRVLLDASAGYILRVEMIDADEERTVIVFSDVKANTDVGPEVFELKLPKDVKVTRPLERLQPARRG